MTEQLSSTSDDNFALLEREENNLANAKENLLAAKQNFFAEFDWPEGSLAMQNWQIDNKVNMFWYSTPISIVFSIGRMRCEFDKKDVLWSRDGKYLIVPSTRVEWLYVLRAANGLTVELNQV